MKEYTEETDVETLYDLVANVYHSNDSYKTHVFCEPKDQWYLIEDLVVEQVMPQSILLSESYIQIWRRRG